MSLTRPIHPVETSDQSYDDPHPFVSLNRTVRRGERYAGETIIYTCEDVMPDGTPITVSKQLPADMSTADLLCLLELAVQEEHERLIKQREKAERALAQARSKDWGEVSRETPTETSGPESCNLSHCALGS